MRKVYLLVFVAVTTILTAQTPKKRTTEFNLDNKVAIHGYDPVAYFTQKRQSRESQQSQQPTKG